MNLLTPIRDFGDIAKGALKSRPGWLNFTKKVAQMTGHHRLLDYTSSFNNLEKFVFYSNNWTIGGIAFDGIMKTEHTSTLKATHYPVQTGVNLTDHAIIDPSTLDIEIMISDAHVKNSLSGVHVSNWLADKALGYLVKRFLSTESTLSSGNRSESAWTTLKAMQLSRCPITVITRLGTYENMIIEKLTSADDVTTLYGLKANIHLVQIQVAEVSEVQVSARSKITDKSDGGAKAVNTTPSHKTQSLAAAIKKAL